MKSTDITYHEILGDVLGEEGISAEQLIKLNIFFSQSIVENSFITKKCFIQNWKEKYL